MVEPSDPGFESGDVVSVPPLVEFRAHATESFDEVVDRRVVAPRCDIRAELRQGTTRLVFPPHDEVAHLGEREQDPHQVPFILRERGDRREQLRLGAVPTQVLPRRSEQVGGDRVDRVEEPLRPVRHVDPDRRAGGSGPVPGQLDEMIALGAVESEHAGERVEHLDRCLDRAPLFEPGVPTHRHAGEHRHLLAS